MRKKRKRKSGGNPKGKSAPHYPFEFKLKLVRLHLEDGYGVPMLAQEFGVIWQSTKFHRFFRLSARLVKPRIFAATGFSSPQSHLFR